MGNKIDLIGKVFGRLVVIKEDHIRGNRNKIKWICNCTCGKQVSVIGESLRNRSTKSCGCLQKEVISRQKTTHNLSGHPLNYIWRSMKQRCSNPNNKSYKNYGERGITVCDRWLESFENFYNDVIGSYKKGLQIDRIDNNGNYEPSNCRWVTLQQNISNAGSSRGSSSIYKGVSWNASKHKWVSQIAKDGKNMSLGSFTCEKEAALAYNEKALELNNKYAHLNKVEVE